MEVPVSMIMLVGVLLILTEIVGTFDTDDSRFKAYMYSSSLLLLKSAPLKFSTIVALLSFCWAWAGGMWPNQATISTCVERLMNFHALFGDIGLDGCL